MASLNIRSSARTSIDNLYVRVQNEEFGGEEVTSPFLRTTLGNLEGHYNRFVNANLELIGAADENALSTHNQLFDNVEAKYTMIKSKLTEIIESLAIEEASVHTQRLQQEEVREVQSTSNDLRLEKIVLPEFNGEFHRWLGFSVMFESMVNSQPNLSVAAKYTRLMKALSGEAQMVVAGFLPTDNNYEEAWMTLKNRYDNQRLIISSHLSIFLNMEGLPKETSVGLRRMVDITKQTTRSLKAIDRPVEHWDDILVHILTTKLPKPTLIDWEKEQKTDELPKLSELLTLMESRARGLDHLAPSHHGKPKKVATATAENLQRANAGALASSTPKVRRSDSVSKGCYYCQGSHFIGRCDKLAAVAVGDRLDKIKNSNLCYNCLTPGHSKGQCQSTRNCLQWATSYNFVSHTKAKDGQLGR